MASPQTANPEQTQMALLPSANRNGTDQIILQALFHYPAHETQHLYALLP